MSAQKGMDMLLKIHTSRRETKTVAGLRANAIAFNSETIDITHAQSTNRWRELLEGGGVKTAAIRGAGLFLDETADETIRSTFFGGNIKQWTILIPDFGNISGKFQITALEYAARHDGEITFEIALESAANINFTPI